MFTAGPADPLYRFGTFIADPVVGRLYHGTDEVPLTPKAFKVLMVLVDKRGQRVDKDELFSQVWPDTFVEQNNLARSISMIRKALHERDNEQEYIVTLRGRGYRFVASVDQISRVDFAARSVSAGREAAPVAAEPPPEEESHANAELPHALGSPDRPAPAAAWRSTRLAAGAGIAAALTVVFGATVAWQFVSHDAPPGQPAERRLWQLTSTDRLEAEPSWSPDGRQVAYSSDRNGNFDIWVQPVSAGSPIRITSGAARDWQPSWSPDGRYIAFRSERDGGGLFVVPAIGGSDRRISSFGYQPRWSPDGSSILFCDSLDAYVVGLNGSAPSQVISNALSGITGRCRVAWHPDGRRISAYSNDREYGWTFWTTTPGGGPRIRSRIAPAVAKRLKDAGLRLGNFVWAPAGNTLYFEGRSDDTENVWRIRVDPRTLEWIEGPERLTTGSSLESGLTLSPDGTRLAFGSRVERTVAWSLPFDPASGRIVGQGEPVTPEGAKAEILDMSPDGTQLVYRVNGRGRQELWIRSLDLRADRLRTVEAEASIVQPRWSRDGTQLAYLRRPADVTRAAAVVLLGAAHDGEERVLRASRSPEMVYDWSADGRSLLVRCRTTSVQPAICLLPNSASSGTAPEMRVIAEDATRSLYAAKHSPDERWVSFIASPDGTRSTVYVTPAGGGSWVAMTGDRYFEDKPRWSPDGRTLYFLSNRTGFWNVWARRFDSIAGKPLGEPFQVSHFDSSVQMVRHVSDLQIAITRERLILPITQTSGAIWVLENVDQ